MFHSLLYFTTESRIAIMVANRPAANQPRQVLVLAPLALLDQ